MICGVKYCGGCNPRYNRTNLFNQVKEMCPEIDFQYVQPDVQYDHLLVIQGCTSKCASIETIIVKGDIFHIWEENQLEALISQLLMK